MLGTLQWNESVIQPLCRAAALLGLCLSSAGCENEQFADAEPVFRVTGTLTWENQPMNGAVITFHPADSNLTAQATADENGNYTLTTYMTGDGAPAGQYVVTIHWPGEAPPATSDDPDPPLPPDRLQQAYTDVRTTSLQVAVREEENTIDFALP